MARSKRRFLIPALIVSAVLAVTDQMIKNWALGNLKPFTGKPFIGDVLKFYLVWNDSAAFSISLGATWIFTIISSVAALVIVWLLSKSKSGAWATTLAILLGGVVGNLIDRLVRAPGFPIGKVVDFLQLPFGFPIFNFADICITSAMTAVVILVMRGVSIGLK